MTWTTRLPIYAAIVAAAALYGAAATRSLWMPQDAIRSPVERAMAATVLVEPLEGAGNGTGFLVSPTLVMTNKHVTEKAGPVAKITLDHGGAVQGVLKWTSATNDIAVYEIPSLPGATVLELDCRAPVVGEPVFVIGNPMNMRWAGVWGFVATDRLSKPMEGNPGTVALDITVGPGNSGSAVMSAEGKVLGVIFGLSVAQMGPFGGSFLAFAFMVPSTEVCKHLP